MKIKICGITNLEDAKYCVKLGADAVGFIFYKQSKRYVEPTIAKNIISELPPFISNVGVFVNEDKKTVNSIAKDLKLSLVQLHGEESPDYVSTINYPVIKSFRIDDKFDFSKLGNYSNCSFLLDAFHKTEYGGTGLSFDWTKIPLNLRKKIILAGGVSEENIELIHNQINPYAVDISSSVEIEPGKKDHKKLDRLFKIFNELREK